MYLMHKDIKVAKIIMSGRIPRGILKIMEPEHVPIGLGTSARTADMYISSWHSRRAIPYGRVNSEKLFEQFGKPEKLSVLSMGLSLTDCYWYTEDPDIKWEDVSLHRNGFSPDLLLYSQGLLKAQGISPDYTTDGYLEKFWTMDVSGPMLIKSGDVEGITKGSGVLAANEVAACRVADLMGINHAEYKLVRAEDNNSGKKRLLCASRCFIDDDSMEFITAESLKDHIGKMSDLDLAIFDDFAEMGMEKDLKTMKKFDLLLGNHDRHLSNFGYLRDSDTLKVIGFAPLYDSGSCLGWSRITDPEMKPYYKSRSELMRDIDIGLTPNIDKVKKIIADTYEEASIPAEQTGTAMQMIDSFYKAQGLNAQATDEPEL